MGNDFHRRQSDREPGLDRDDLFLLMESYRNTIEMNTQLLERQETLNSALEKILIHAEKLSDNQAAITDQIKQVVEKIKTVGDGIKGAIDKGRQDTLKEHHQHTIRLYMSFSVLAAIIVSLLGLIVKIWPG